MSTIKRTYSVSFTVHGETPPKREIVKASSKKDVKSELLTLGHNVDEIVSCHEK